MTVTYRLGDALEQCRQLEAGSVDLVVTSPPFLALRSYLPADHPDKGKEIGSEGTPAAFLDVMIALTKEWRRILAPHGSICVELGDTYAGSGGAGGDYGDGGMREGQGKADGSSARSRERPRNDGGRTSWRPGSDKANQLRTRLDGGGRGWPLAKSLSGIPTLYTWSLAYGRNLLNPTTTLEPWRIRNLIVWARPNPPVGALGDKFRPATSYITVACVGAKRYFDLDAVRQEATYPAPERAAEGPQQYAPDGQPTRMTFRSANPAGAPPLDWHADNHPEDGDWLWKLPTAPFKGSHYATFPLELPRRLILAMCPQRVCRVCGKPSERIAVTTNAVGEAVQRASHRFDPDGSGDGRTNLRSVNDAPHRTERETVGWTDCGHNDWRPGLVCDPFGGSGTTGEAAIAVGRDAILIDLDQRNLDMARDRCGLFLAHTETEAPCVDAPSQLCLL